MENGWIVVLVELSAGEHSLFDIFDENGRYVGQFESDLTAEYGRLFFKNSKAYALGRDEEGYQFIKRFSFTIEDY